MKVPVVRPELVREIESVNYYLPFCQRGVQVARIRFTNFLFEFDLDLTAGMAEWQDPGNKRELASTHTPYTYVKLRSDGICHPMPPPPPSGCDMVLRCHWYCHRIHHSFRVNIIYFWHEPRVRRSRNRKNCHILSTNNLGCRRNSLSEGWRQPCHQANMPHHCIVSHHVDDTTDGCGTDDRCS